MLPSRSNRKRAAVQDRPPSLSGSETRPSAVAPDRTRTRGTSDQNTTLYFFVSQSLTHFLASAGTCVAALNFNSAAAPVT